MTNIIPRIDLMIAYSCNISCKGCISISDRKRDGIAKFEDVVEWLKKWKYAITPKVVTIFGGEPCLHPKLIEICHEVENTWEDSKIRLITNGYLLSNFSKEEWFKFKNFEIQVSVHRKDHEQLINSKIKDILLYKNDWIVKKHGGNDHKQISWTTDTLTIYKSIFKDFVIPYKNNLEPWNSDPEKAHKICGAGSTPILYKGKLYKCPAISNIIDLTNSTYKNYNGYDVNDNLKEFIDNIGKPESICGYCPELSQATIIDHLNINNVTVKQKNIN